jgi:hypothetical protein
MSSVETTKEVVPATVLAHASQGLAGVHSCSRTASTPSKENFLLDKFIVLMQHKALILSLNPLSNSCVGFQLATGFLNAASSPETTCSKLTALIFFAKR